MRILIIEDQESLSKLLKKGFEKEGYAADYVLDGEAGQRRIEIHHEDYDVIVLDLMLPKKSGFEVCKNIRSFGITTPVIVLTAKDSEEDKVSLLDSGADDYIVKPFSFRELLARVRALTRRPETSLPTELSIGDLVLKPAIKAAFVGNKEIKLTLTEFRLLEYLMRNPNQVLEREAITTNIWDFDFDSFSNIVDVYINRLRKKIDAGRKNGLLKTVRGVGYKISTN
ncbi:MAG: DNA-binding response regulator [Candidatus Staskawiczbacteria bacterium RIFOXYD2_FULL_37_9]|uniref:DNA-binding response regulator n=1 Tax=Candidatus Staskawiczbacteria bacterium RIFOXYB1_FULL_37_44 TaxID=1802223 RepID=A0A1G2IW18_9BACT|nr:MAG: DNA-binding response regulator [Candidatus Staskawiczbacteria bacterium RIFOXYB1_FULL_37_44]OGZ83058.1 MAG: DNA-binding response regulator [Candidatus Staskawiczbacteria bacterium RIFOXYC1_FULL_37_52]OGZ87553.1 MAG: DNA-binding response regulator [Candidatus Staskawiczbacteria bacterium RIFOXYC2_FULL_37_19]OGZ90159.1 MAG: DNA-binding response regulator [Candidatus Staskawiczbacteria bacterium RIFOXYD1_FULL_37_110]OGZ93147.1 MAG: DNA-binding response regulator [Candidatus Staskawiczbacte